MSDFSNVGFQIWLKTLYDDFTVTEPVDGLFFLVTNAYLNAQAH